MTRRLSEELTKQDLIIIIAGCIQISLEDGVMQENEDVFITKLLEHSQLTHEEQDKAYTMSEQPIEKICSQIKNKSMQEMFTLCLVLTSISDQHLDDSENKLLEKIKNQFDISSINLEKLNYGRFSQMVFSKIDEIVLNNN